MSTNHLILPGDIVAVVGKYHMGDNVYINGGSIIASRVGHVKILSDKGKEKISVKPILEIDKSLSSFYDCIRLNTLVICKAKSFSDYQCKVDIICCGGKPLISSYRGVIYMENIRSHYDADFSKSYHSFRVGDFILGRVVGVFDNRSARERVIFLISTAEPELGVILCKSPFDKNSFMLPFSWKEMICPVSHRKELRKVAKVIIKEE